MTNSAQFSFALPLTTAYRQADFAVSASNRTAYEQVISWPDWSQPVLILQGPAASGKTHLAHIWAEQSAARVMFAAQLNTEAAAAIIEAGEAARPWVVEGIDAVAEEAALFHLLNAVREHGGSLLLTTPQPPAQLEWQLADLRSRLCAAPLAALDTPDEEVLAAVIRKQFADRQLRVGDDVIHYLLLRMSRSFDAARDWVERIDKAALAQQRKVTVALVRNLLDEQDRLL